MKKSIIIAAFGIVVGVASSYGQGSIVFSSYVADGLSGATTKLFGSSTLLGNTYQAALYYSIGTVADAVDNNSTVSISSLPTGFTLLTGVTAQFATGSATAGYFDGPAVVIPGYVSGPISFEVVAYNGSDFNSSTIRGRSGAWTEPSISTGSTPAGNFTAMPNMFVAPVTVPEPSTLALAGLGGLGMLLAFRRKKA